MSRKDQLHRFTFEGLGLRGELVQLEASWQALLARHPGYPEPIQQLLGEGCAAVLLLSAVIKFQGSLILQLQSQGMLRMLVAQATEKRTMRGLARWEGDVSAAPKLDDLIENGRLVFTVQAPNGERYQGIVPVEGDHLAAAIEGYFAQSEQLATRIWLASDGQRAAGLMLQELPSQKLADEDWRRIGMLADTVRPEEMLELPADELLHRLFHEESVRLYEPDPVAFRCTCSKEKTANLLVSLGHDEVEQALSEEGEINVDCEFCGKRYRYDRVDIEMLFNGQAMRGPSGTQH